MGNCVYCMKPAGFFRSQHKQCRQDIETVTSKINLEIINFFTKKINLEYIENFISKIFNEYSNIINQRTNILIKSFDNSIEHLLNDGLIDESEEKLINQFCDKFSISGEQLDLNGNYSKIVKSLVLSDLTSGILPQRIKLDIQLNINFQKSESIIWLFNSCNLLEQKTRRAYVGASSGVSIRIAKGVYYRVGQFRGNPIERTENLITDNGIVIVTNKNIYFQGNKKSFRIPFNKIVAFEPFSDGIGVLKDGVSAKPIYLITNDGWFTYNLCKNVGAL